MTIRPFGESAFLVELEQRVDEALVARAGRIADAWERGGLGPAVPAYASVLLRFDPVLTEPATALAAAEAVTIEASDADRTPGATGGTILIPTRYDGPDLAEVAGLSGLTVDELIAAHTGREHQAWFLGFMPGFAYCGPLDPRISAPRLASPRPRVPAGAVAVADGQTAVYPFDSPGGWRLIGRTEIALFDPDRPRPALIRPGDRLRFVPL